MTRRLAADRQHRRLLRMRPTADRTEHGQDLAPVALRPEPRPEGAAAQRVDQRALRALAEENALLARELGLVQARCTRWRDDCVGQVERLEALLMRARGELIAKQTLIAALHDTLEARGACAAGDLAERARSPATALAARHVLCVGGRARQVPVYRELVERGGGRFTHIDGAGADCLPQLSRLLAQADLVILQPGYVCQGVCQAVESHCARSGIRCVQLDKACVIGFARSLEQAVAAA